MKKAKPALVLLMKVLVSVGLFVFFFTRIHIERFFHTFASADFSYIALALVVYFLSQFLSTLRWEILARPLGFKKPFMVFLKFYLIGMFFNLFAPGTVGGDVSVAHASRWCGSHGHEHRHRGAGRQLVHARGSEADPVAVHRRDSADPAGMSRRRVAGTTE